jgi:hypothetical protein
MLPSSLASLLQLGTAWKKNCSPPRLWSTEPPRNHKQAANIERRAKAAESPGLMEYNTGSGSGRNSKHTLDYDRQILATAIPFQM